MTEEHPMAYRLLMALLLSLFLAGCGAGGTTVVAPGGAGSVAVSSTGEAFWAQEVMDLTNAVRAEHGVPPLIWDERAATAAYLHAWDMDVRNYFAHESPDGTTPADRQAAQGIDFIYAGENLARGQKSPEEVVQAWLDSPDHRENLLSDYWTHVGIAVHSGPDRGPWWAQEFYR